MPAPVQTIGDASAAISALVDHARLAGGFATMVTGRDRERLLHVESECMAQAFALAGPVSADILAMSDAELLAELEA